MKEGTTQAVILWDLYDMGYRTVKVAAAAMKGKSDPQALDRLVQQTARYFHEREDVLVSGGGMSFPPLWKTALKP